MRQYLPYPDETLYIAGPACFYVDGYALWHGLRGLAEFHGFRVVMPTTNQLDLTHEDLRLNADAIFQNCAAAMNETTAVIADLESFRGTEPDGGTLFELGMGYARGCRLVAYTRDRRPLNQKASRLTEDNRLVNSATGQPFPYGALPFCPSLMASTRIVEGGFETALQALQSELDWSLAQTGWQETQLMPEWPAEDADTVFLFSPRFYRPGQEAWLEGLRSAFARLGLKLLTLEMPAEKEPDTLPDEARAWAGRLLRRWERQIRRSAVCVFDLNDWNRYEPSGDAGFLAGLAWQLGKKTIGFMDDPRRMRDRIPHGGPDQQYKDAFGNDVENFNYPINLMFASAMPIVPWTGPDALAKYVAELR